MGDNRGKEIVYFQGIQGYDFPGNTIATVYYHLSCSCHVKCMKRDGCRGWVHRTASRKCELKSVQMDSSHRVKCGDCFATDPAATKTFPCLRHPSSTPETSTARSDVPKEQKILRPAEEGDRCRVSTGFDQPADFNLRDEPVTVSDPYLCCDSCSQSPSCKSWVWNRETLECWMKNHYDASKNDISCEACISHDPNGTVATVQTIHRLEAKDRSWEYRDDEGIYMPMDIANSTCKMTVGFDQPAKYDLLLVPMVVKYSYLCCDECAKRDDCASWVYHKDRHECFLKRAYKAEESKIPCDQCIAYSPNGGTYTYQKSAATSTYSTVFWYDVASSKWKADRYGAGSAWDYFTGMEMCTFSQGFNQPEEYDIEEVPDIASAAECCGQCNVNDQCRSWVWRANLHTCVLKNHYDSSLNDIPCGDCVAYAEDSEFYVYMLSWDDDDILIGYRRAKKHEKMIPYKEFGEKRLQTEELPQEVVPASKDSGLDRGESKGSTSSTTLTCTYAMGEDQPARFNLPDMPMEVEYAYLCCEACSRNPECKSWVWRFHSNECYLKNTYEEDGERKKCEDCIAYSRKSTEHIAEKVEPVQKSSKILTTQEKGEHSGGHGGKGYDLHGYDLRPGLELSFKRPRECCVVCVLLPECRAWVFNEESGLCMLKTQYKPETRKPCEGCYYYDKEAKTQHCDDVYLSAPTFEQSEDIAGTPQARERIQSWKRVPSSTPRKFIPSEDITQHPHGWEGYGALILRRND